LYTLALRPLWRAYMCNSGHQSGSILKIHCVHTLSAAARRGYLLTQVAGGVWADKFGGKRVLGFGVVWWSVATALTPLAASLGLPALLLARACMGVGEGVAMPAMNNLLSRCGPAAARPGC